MEDEKEQAQIDALLGRILRTDDIELMVVFQRGIEKAIGARDDRLDLLATLQAIALMEPRDYSDALLCANAVIAHNQVMDWVGESRDPLGRQADGVCCMNMAVKLMDVVTRSIEAMDRRHNRGKQQIRVEHVNVAAGGQAVVGNIERTQPCLDHAAADPEIPRVATRARVRRRTS